jgi:malate synthase
MDVRRRGRARASLDDVARQSAETEGDRLTPQLFERLLDEEYEKLRRAGNRDVHDQSKDTTLPIAREIVRTLIAAAAKSPWYIYLLNATLDNHDLVEAKTRIQQ